MQLAKTALLLVLIVIFPNYANAYIGPGLGAGTIGVILGIVGSLFIALFAIIWYPLKRLFKKKKESKHQDGNK
jgi:preprotein translocase subunit SecF